MAQTTEAERQPTPAFITKDVVCCGDGAVMAFSPSIIEIGYIDDDEPPSDLSDGSSTADADKPLDNLSDEPPKVGDDKPPVDLSGEPLTADADKPLIDLSEEQLMVDADKPMIDLSDEPLTADADKPLIDFSDEPLTADADKPLIDFSDEPSTADADKPLLDLSDGSSMKDADQAERSASEPLTKGVTDEVVIHSQEVERVLHASHLSHESLTCNHVPPDEVPDQEVVRMVVHSNKTFTSESTIDHPHALESSETEDKDDSSITSSSLNASSTVDEIITETAPAQTLDESMITLQLALEDRSTLIAFEHLEKKKPDEPMEVAKALENVPKNRYKDVLPYDASRVVLQDGFDGDYINASFVQMKLPPPRKPTEYIATQGPLPQTCNDFWQMVWEQKCGIVVMVTTLKERNRVKCHQYWPDLSLTESYDKFQVTCFSETTSATGVMRDFLICNQKVNEERHVIQLQYINWPDHGVPEDSSDFLQFVQQLRDLRRDVGGVVVVHCSAGVGRTGVLILMETAMGYIDADEPIYPLEMVKEMRDQRVMMVQTMVQYRFICEALLKAYKDRCKLIENE